VALVPAAQSDASTGRELAILYLVFAALAVVVYSPSLRGEFLSDDFGYIVTNPYIQALSLANLRVLLDPFGPAAAYTANYAPVHLLGHALEWRIFGADTLGWHVVNVLLHAGVSLLLVPTFQRAGLSRGMALFGALFFLLHPANVEAVAWIFQLKTILCVGFGVAALLAHPRHPAVAALLFSLGLLSKTTALFALPVALYFAWREWRASGTRPPHVGWLLVWVLVLVLYAVPQLLAFAHLGEASAFAPSDPVVQARTMLAIAGRYLVMAVSSYGVSAFQHPPLVVTWLDPWWLGALVIGIALAFRAVASIVRGRIEGGFWIWAAAAYAPVSQLFPFLYPMADRYLYAVLPGLLGVALLAGADLARRLSVPRAILQRAGAVAGLLVLVLFAALSYDRAAVFRSNASFAIDSAKNYPDGLSGNMLRARRAAQEGDVEAVVAALRRAAELGFDSFGQLQNDPAMADVRRDARFRAVVAEVAGRWIETARARGYSTQLELRGLAQAHEARGEWAEAVTVLERAAATGGPVDAEIRSELLEARRQLEAEKRRASEGTGGTHGAPAP
jgi:hypothetical protein